MAIWSKFPNASIEARAPCMPARQRSIGRLIRACSALRLCRGVRKVIEEPWKGVNARSGVSVECLVAAADAAVESVRSGPTIA